MNQDELIQRIQHLEAICEGAAGYIGKLARLVEINTTISPSRFLDLMYQSLRGNTPIAELIERALAGQDRAVVLSPEAMQALKHLKFANKPTDAGRDLGEVASLAITEYLSRLAIEDIDRILITASEQVRRDKMPEFEQRLLEVRQVWIQAEDQHRQRSELQIKEQ